MNSLQGQLIDIARRKQRLIERAESQRAVIGASFRQLQAPISVIDRGLEIVRYLRAHPLLVTAVIATVVAFRRRGLASIAGRALSVWRVWRAVAAWSV